VLGSIYYYFIA